MAENRCSMCGNTNAPDAQVCANCGARLTPVRPSKPKNTGKFTGGLSWLDAFREETQPADAAASAFGQGEASFEQDMSAYDEEESPSFGQSAAEDDDAPDWLQRIRSRNESEQVPVSFEAEDEIRVDEGSLSFAEESAEDVPDWLRSLKDQDESAAAAQEEQIPSWQDAMSSWGTDTDEDESIASAYEEEGPKAAEWFDRVNPGKEQEKPAPKQTVHFEQEEELPTPKQTVQFDHQPNIPDSFSPFEDDEEEPLSEESALPSDDDFLSQFEDYQHPSGFSEEDYATAKGDDLQYEDWETRSASLSSVTESAETNNNVPSWLDEDGGDDSDLPGTSIDDNSQSVLNWLEELDEKEGGKQKARYWMGEVDTGELPPDQAVESRFSMEPKQEESVYDPFAEDKKASPGSTQFFSEDELDDEYEAPAKTPIHTMMFNQDESEKDIPDWLSDDADDDETQKPGQTVGLSGLDDSVLGMDFAEDEKAPWEMESHGFDDDNIPRTPIMTAQLPDLDDEEGDEEVPPWLQDSSSEPTEPRKKTPMMTAEPGNLGDESDEESSEPWLQQTPSFEEPSVPRSPKMTAALPGLDDEDLGMNLDDDEIPPWLQQSEPEKPVDTPRTPIMTAALEGFDDDEDDEETILWVPDAESAEQGKKPSLMTAALTGLTEEDFSEEEETPAWMQDIMTETSDIYKTPSQPLMTAELPDLGDEAADDELPPWMQDVDKAYDEQPSQPVNEIESAGFGESSADEEDLPFWMQDVEPETVQKAPSQPLMTAALTGLDDEDAQSEDAPDWMWNIEDSTQSADETPFMAGGMAEEDAITDEPPAWMQDIAEATPPAKQAPIMTAALSGLDEEDFQTDETPAWMQDIEEVAPPAKGTPTMTAALSGLDEEEFETEETPAWMQDLEEIAPPPSMPVMTAALPDLDQNEPTMPPPASQAPVEEESDEIPDWMRTVEETRQLGRMPGQPPQSQKSPFTVGLTGDAEEKEQSIDEMFSDDLFTTGKLNEMVDADDGGEAFLSDAGSEMPPPATAPEEQSFDDLFAAMSDNTEPAQALSEDELSIDEMFSDQLLSTGKLNDMVGQPGGMEETSEEELSIDEMFSDQLLTTGRLNAMSGMTDGAGEMPKAAEEEDEESSIDEMFSDQLLTTGKLNAMVGMPGIPEEESDEEDQSIDDIFSDQLLTTGKLNAMVGMPGMPEDENDEEDQSIDDMFSDQLLTTGKLNAMVGMPGMPEEKSDEEDQSIDDIFSDQLLSTGKLNAMVDIPGIPEEESDEDQSIDDMFSDQLFTTGALNEMKVKDQSAEGLSIDEAFSEDLLNTGRLKEMSSGLEPTQAMPTESAADDDWLADFGAAASDGDDMLVGASVIDDEPKGLPASVSPGDDMPDWLAELEPEGEEVHTGESAAFVFDDAHDEPEAAEESHPFAGDDLPNWLSPDVWQAEGQQNGESTPQAEDAGVGNIQWELEGLEKAEVPSWLQQIKPGQMPAKKARPLTSESIEEQSEKVGPLAGLSGVLPAQDTVTMHRRPPVYSDQLTLSEKQSNHVQVLSRMMESEAKNKTLKIGLEKIPFKMMRVIFAVVLMIIMMIPLSGLIPITGGLPFAASDPVVAFFREVEQFPEDSSVLLVMDFESGYTAEMRSSLDGLMMRLYEKNINVAMVSTLPTGPVIAEEIAQDMWWNYYEAHPEINAIDYETRVLNLGYLPGGSAAMLQFVRYPRQSVQYGFGYEGNPTSVWESGVLSDVYNTNDFSGVIVITDSANISRNWIEQTTLYSLDNILFVTSAQTYPLILPYWQSGQVKGLIAGMYQGYTYRTLLGQSEGLASRWFSYQFGMNLVTIVAIFLTIIFIIRNTLPRIQRKR